MGEDAGNGTQPTEQVYDGEVIRFTNEIWLLLESLSLERELPATAQSLDETLEYAKTRCDAVRKVG